jgi:hypothetical protein
MSKIVEEMYMVAINTEAAVWERLIQPEHGDLEPALALYLLSLEFRPEDVERMNDLAAAAREGSLSHDQQAELNVYRHVGHVLALLQSKARMAVRETLMTEGVFPPT